MSEKLVLVTGASGLLGRAVISAFKSSGWSVLGTAFSRAQGDLLKLDIRDAEQVQEFINRFNPNAVVHCAAQRFPDKVESDIEGSIKLNVDSTRCLAKIAASRGATFLYISSDYVFDGTKPPYNEDDIPNPLNTYGKTKLEGEHVTLNISQEHIVLRIPVLFGTVEYLGESAVTILLELLLNKEPKSVSDYEIRYPSHVDDIAQICLHLIELKREGKDIKGIYQWSGLEPLTKFGMVQAISEVFNLAMDHITPDPNPVPGALRPYNSQLSNQRIDSLSIGKHTPFRDAIKSSLSPFLVHH